VPFHVSPFNDRLGTYSVSVHAPFYHSSSDIALLQVSPHLHPPLDTLKFSASLCTKHVAPFRILAEHVTHPFTHFLTPPLHSPLTKPPCCTTASVYTIGLSLSPIAGLLLCLTLTKGGGTGWRQPTILDTRACRSSSCQHFLMWCAYALQVGVMSVKLPSGDLHLLPRFFHARSRPGRANDTCSWAGPATCRTRQARTRSWCRMGQCFARSSICVDQLLLGPCSCSSKVMFTLFFFILFRHRG
jgi:Protein of unknown function (DUF1365)